MPIAFQKQVQLNCPTCGADFAALVWLILDAQEQPAAVEALLRGDLNMIYCPSCGAGGLAQEPLLFHDAQARRVIFAPPPGTAEYDWRDQFRDLSAALINAIPEAQRRPYLAEAEIAQDLAGIARRLHRAQQRRALAETSRPFTAMTPPLPKAAPPPLLLAVQTLLAANTPEELAQVLTAHPVLLAPATDPALAELTTVAVEQGDSALAESLREVRAFLVRMRAARPVTPEPADTPEITAIPPGVFQALLAAQSNAELTEVAALYPLLLHPTADRLLTAQVELVLDEGYERLAHALEERREALAQLRQGTRVEATTLDEAIEALLHARGKEAFAEVLDRYPILFEAAALQALWQFATEARASGDAEQAHHAIACRELLLRIRDGLAD